MSKDFLYPLRRLHGWLHEYPAYKKERNALLKTYVPQVREYLRQHPKSVFLVMTPEHGNLGDHAIASAEAKLLQRAQIDYFEIPDHQLNALNRCNLLGIMNGFPIMVNGGGNMGTLWFDAEKTHRRIIQKNPKSKVFIFPNTLFYEDTDWGRSEFERSIQIYNRHKGLFLYAREKHSYEIMKKAYRNVRLIPDMVFSLNESARNLPRQGCLLCLRNDCERTRTDEQDRILREQVHRLFGDAVRDTTMVVKGGVRAEQRSEALEQKFAEFAAAELVITDRLHGMIFCAITGTPCIVINSRSPKVRGCYEWIQNLGYIAFTDDVTQIIPVYNHMEKAAHFYDNTHLEGYYQELEREIQENLHWRWVPWLW